MGVGTGTAYPDRLGSILTWRGSVQSSDKPAPVMALVQRGKASNDTYQVPYLYLERSQT